MKNWSELNEILSATSEGLSSKIDEQDHDLIADFIENREFGVAYDWILEMIKKNKIDPDTQTRNNLVRAAMLMEIPPPY